MLFATSEEFSKNFEYFFFVTVNCNLFPTFWYLVHESWVVTSVVKEQFKKEGVI